MCFQLSLSTSSPSAVRILSETCDLRGCSPVIFLPPVSSWMVRKRFAALCSSSSVFDACSCLLHPGENHLDRNQIKSLCMTLCQAFNRTVIYCYSVFMFSSQVAKRCDAACQNIVLDICY